jgi:hypothetical protein
VVFVRGGAGEEVDGGEEEERDEEGVDEIVDWMGGWVVSYYWAVGYGEGNGGGEEGLQRGTRSTSAWGKAMRRSLSENMRWKGTTRNWIWSCLLDTSLLSPGRRAVETHQEIACQQQDEADVVGGICSL